MEDTTPNFYGQALRELAEGKFQYVMSNGTIRWREDATNKPTQEQIDAKMNEFKSAWEKTEYQRLRKAEYDKLNQDEMRFDDLENGTTTWQDAINAIKAKYPKPE